MNANAHDETRQHQRDPVQRLEVAVGRLETLLAEREKNCARHQAAISDLYRRQDAARSLLITTLLSAIAAALGALFSIFRSKAGLLLAACLLLAGCGTARQSAADALAGLDAIHSQVEADPALDMIFAGVADHVLATVGAGSRTDLPAPRLTTAAIQADPPAYAAQAAQDREDAAGGFWSSVGGFLADCWPVVSAGLALVLMILAKKYPILEPVAALLTSRRTIRHRQEVVAQADAATTAYREERSARQSAEERAGVNQAALDEAVTLAELLKPIAAQGDHAAVVPLIVKAAANRQERRGRSVRGAIQAARERLPAGVKRDLMPEKNLGV
jgi:hypothetical protein